MSAFRGLGLALGTLTVLPAHVADVDRRTAGSAMTLAPLVGLLLGLISAAVFTAAVFLGTEPLLATVLALGSLAVLTRGLHLDGLADLADGLGSGKAPREALEVMRRSDIGPFGVMALAFTLLAQAAALAESGPAAPLALITACVTGRLTLTWACREGVPAARPEGLGAMVAGTVGRGAALTATALVLGGAALGGLTCQAGALVGGYPYCAPAEIAYYGAADAPASARATEAARSGLGVQAVVTVEPVDPMKTDSMKTDSAETADTIGIAGLVPVWAALPAAALAGLVAAWLLRRRAVRRLGGITGDVLGALVETAAATVLVVCAILL
ncbi:adenosylcobinamide-GDP ribazoletransferase [Thermocatellispora tengchongensis]|uniref:Adenosylcobinamide-GDP ribazoletransferase n=1 Tax=Thermocatellispora tengchongensis TaxID=1073253 RepID=A0A840PLS9_9ACTN|nr:adenosylcobinamide-GDP ribazoletransferase [Thermocatellispora tengchongensis]MBB5140042.1 adenosylcobinamide-GDP ribazoletransferase [Thermocatellispora tengchongensis]